MNKTNQNTQSIRKYRQAKTAIRLLLKEYVIKKDNLSNKELFEYV